MGDPKHFIPAASVLCTAPSGASPSFSLSQGEGRVLSLVHRYFVAPKSDTSSSILLASRLVSLNDQHACHPFEVLRTTQYITKLNLKLEAERINAITAKELGEILKASPGKCKVSFQIFSNAEGMALEAPSKSLSVTLTEDVIRGLDGLPEVSYSLS